jgi:putative ABC transport system permease protein
MQVMGIRYAVRSLRQSRAFALGVVITVALNVGATTAIFSVVYGVLLRQLPYRDVDRVFWIWSDRPGRDRSPFNVPDFIDYRDSTRTLSAFAGYFAYSANLNDESSSERVQGLRATANFFDVLGASPRLGRLLGRSDEGAGSDHVVVLAEAFWTRRFGADATLIGRVIRLNGEAYTVVGVMDGGFATPIRDVDFVIPFAPDRDPRHGARGSLNFMHGAGRLRDGATAAEAASELNGVAGRLRERFPVENATKRGVRLVELVDGVAGPFRTALLTILAAVGGVLLIACANVANLMLTRASARARATAVQRALGAPRSAIVRHVLLEALVLAVVGGALGIALAYIGVTGLVAAAPAGLPRLAGIHVDTGVMAFAFALSAVTGLLFGVVPAFVAGRVDVRDALQGATRGATAANGRIRKILIGCEVALAVALLIAVTTLGRSFAHVLAVTPGFDTTRALSARLTLPPRRFASRSSIVTFQRTLTDRLATSPGVQRAGAISLVPLSGSLSRVPFTVEGRPVEREAIPYAQYRLASPGYFAAAGIPVTRGRPFSDDDTDRTRPVAVVSEALAQQWLRGLDPIGARLLVDDNDAGPRAIEIVGLAGNVQQIALDSPPTWDLYLPYAQLHPDSVGQAAGNMFVVVRTAGDPMSAATQLTREIRRVDPDVAASQIQPMGRYVSDAVAPRRFSLALMTVFGAAALALALTGIYAVVLYAASQRTREIGIRLALGAGRPAIVRLVMREGMRAVTIGLIVGTGTALATTRWLASLLFGVAPDDPATFAQVVVVVAGLAAVACALPAVRINPSLANVLKRE